MIIGAQFYTLRDQCKTLEDFAESLKKVADIGYTTVQISGVCAYEPEWLRDQLKANGLQCVITHTPMEKIRDNTRQVIEDHSVFGCDYIGIGSGPNLLKDPADMEQVLDLAHQAGRELHAAGKKLMYHHHSPEFTHNYPAPDGKGLITRLEYLMSHTTPEELGLTMDTYWVQVGGADIVGLIGQMMDRLPCVHLKDLTMNEWEQRMAPIGSGNLHWESILAALEAAEVKYALVEQDLTYDEDPFACLKKSYDYLTALGLK